MKNLSEASEDYEIRRELIEFIGEVELQEQIYKMQIEGEELTTQERRLLQMQYDQAQREDQSGSRSSWEDDPNVQRPRIQMLKVLKVELEEEIEEASWFY